MRNLICALVCAWFALGLRLVCAWFAPAIQGAAQTKSTLNSHGMTIPHHVRQPGGSIKVETVNSSPAPFGKNSANFLRTPKTAKSFKTAEKVSPGVVCGCSAADAAAAFTMTPATNIRRGENIMLPEPAKYLAPDA